MSEFLYWILYIVAIFILIVIIAKYGWIAWLLCLSYAVTQVLINFVGDYNKEKNND